MAEQQAEAYKKKQEELRVQYEKEQDLHNNKQVTLKCVTSSFVPNVKFLTERCSAKRVRINLASILCTNHLLERRKNGRRRTTNPSTSLNGSESIMLQERATAKGTAKFGINLLAYK